MSSLTESGEAERPDASALWLSLLLVLAILASVWYYMTSRSLLDRIHARGEIRVILVNLGSEPALTAGEYRWRVKSRNERGNGSWSSYTYFTVWTTPAGATAGPLEGETHIGLIRPGQMLHKRRDID